MSPADMTPDPSGTPAPAAGNELLIPKARLDEVLAENRRLKESEQIKDQLYLQDRQRFAVAQQPQAAVEETAEDVGLDPQTFQGVKKLASRIAERMVRQKEAEFGQQIGILANRTEKAELLATKGADKAKYLDRIEQMQKDQANRTGTFLPKEVALDLIMSAEKDERIRVLEARLASGSQAPASNQPVVEQTPSSGIPSASGTRQIPGGAPGASGPASNKNFSDLTVEEMEARLEEQFKTGSRA